MAVPIIQHIDATYVCLIGVFGAAGYCHRAGSLLLFAGAMRCDGQRNVPVLLACSCKRCKQAMNPCYIYIVHRSLFCRPWSLKALYLSHLGFGI